MNKRSPLELTLDGPTVELVPATELSPAERVFAEAPTRITDGGDAELTPGAVLRTRYVLEEVIGRGGHCVVYRAKDLHRVNVEDPSASYIALKVLHPAQRHHKGAIARLAREFRQMQILAHPGIARVFDLDCDGDIWFLSMELIVGQTLRDWMRSAPDVTSTMQVVAACANALDYAHSMGIVHGDLKLSNVLRTAAGQVKLIDFGSVPVRSSRQDAEGDCATSATPGYASPQVLSGMRAEPSDDIFSLACLSYGLLSDGELPFGDKSSLEAHRARLCAAAIPGMPVEIFAVLARGLAGDRERRPATAQEFHRDLIGHEPTVPVRRRQRASPAVWFTDRTMSQISLAGVAFVAVCALTAMLPAARRLSAGTGGAAPSAAIVATASAQESALTSPTATAGSAADSSALAAAPAPSGHAAGIVTFESQGIVAVAAQSLIAIPLQRLQSTHGTGAVAWEIQGGSALPNVDYEPVKPQVVRFNDGETVRSLFIPLIHTTGVTSAGSPRTFSVALRQVGGGVRLGPVTRIQVTIVPQPTLSDLSSAVAFTGSPAN